MKVEKKNTDALLCLFVFVSLVQCLVLAKHLLNAARKKTAKRQRKCLASMKRKSKSAQKAITI